MARKINNDEKQLWEKVASTTVPLHRIKVEKTHIEPVFERSDPVPYWSVPQFEISAKSAKTAPAPEVFKKPPVMDAKAFSKMQRGKLRPEARIDLHGMTQDHAHPALMNFISTSFMRGFRLVLVISGKGKAKDSFGPIPERYGVLRQNVPRWLASPALRNMILEVSAAHKSHGGDGAFYVYLRKRR